MHVVDTVRDLVTYSFFSQTSVFPNPQSSHASVSIMWNLSFLVIPLHPATSNMYTHWLVTMSLDSCLWCKLQFHKWKWTVCIQMPSGAWKAYNNPPSLCFTVGYLCLCEMWLSWSIKLCNFTFFRLILSWWVMVLDLHSFSSLGNLGCTVL